MKYENFTSSSFFLFFFFEFFFFFFNFFFKFFNFFFFFLPGFLTWSVSIVELVQLIESKAFSILQFLSNSIQEIVDSSQDLGPETKARLEVFFFFNFFFDFLNFFYFFFLNVFFIIYFFFRNYALTLSECQTRLLEFLYDMQECIHFFKDRQTVIFSEKNKNKIRYNFF